MGSLSFDGLVELYDETRTFDGDCFNAALDYLVERFPPADYLNVYEPGIGTGRIAIPLGQRGYRVTGGDISENMLAILENRLAGCEPRPDITYLAADTTDLPFPDSAFDMTVVVHHFYFIREWKQAVREILRVTDGPVVLMHTGTGQEIPFLNDRYRQLCETFGYAIGVIGVGGTAEVVDYLTCLGRRAERIDERWKWTARIRLETALSHIRDRGYSFTAATPEAVHSAVMTELEREFDLSTTVEVPNQIYLVIVSREQR